MNIRRVVQRDNRDVQCCKPKHPRTWIGLLGQVVRNCGKQTLTCGIKLGIACLPGKPTIKATDHLNNQFENPVRMRVLLQDWQRQLDSTTNALRLESQ